MHAVEPLVPIVGGVVDPDDLVGRKREHEEFLEYVAQGGAYAVGDRRMGKTSLIRKVVRDLRAAGHVVVSVSAETDTLADFEASLLRAIRDESGLERRWSRWTAEFEGEVTVKVGGSGLRLHGALKPSSSGTETDLMVLAARAAQEAGAASVVLVIDEIAMLAMFLQERDPAAGAELLRSLRRLRQRDQDRVRVVLAGSVGLHHAVDDATALNDLPEVRVGPLTHDEAVLLARRNLLGVGLPDDLDLAREIATVCSDIPYYVQGFVSALSQSEVPLDQLDLAGEVTTALDDNRWDTDHYYYRIKKYYPADAKVVVEVLDALAEADGLTRDDLLRDAANRLGAQAPDSAALGEILERLRRDHYLSYDDGSFSFATPFLRTVWRRLRRRLG